MSNWTGLLLNPERINNIFANSDMLLNAVEFHDIVLHRDGPILTLRFDVESFPENPPPKWRSQEFNRIQIQLTLIGVFSVLIQGWGSKIKVDLKLDGQNSNVRITGVSEILKFDVSAEFARVDSISAYRENI